MSRRYAVGVPNASPSGYSRPAGGKLAGAAGVFQTVVGGKIIPAGEPLPAGTTEFDLFYYFTGRYADASGIVFETRFRAELQGVSVGESNAAIVARAQAERAKLRRIAQATTGPPPAAIYEVF
jgi:hypothetical protein